MIGFKSLEAIKHPDSGKIIDLNEATREETGVDDAYLKLYPVDGYGNQELLRSLIKQKNLMQSYTTQTQDFGVGCMIWNTK